MEDIAPNINNLPTPSNRSLPAPYQRNLPTTENPGAIPSQLGDISRLFYKVKITLSDGQFKALFHIIAFWLNKAPAKGELFEKAYYLSVHRLFNSKFQKAIFNLRPRVTISLDICQAETLMEALTDYQLNNSCYEMMTINHIISEIDKQTV